MIKRYSLPKMSAIWQDENKYKRWLQVEVLVAQAQAELGIIPKEAAAEIEDKAQFNAARIEEIEKEVNHDVIAFLTNVAEYVGEPSRYIHFGLTSSDILDTALSLLLVEAADILIDDANRLIKALKDQANRYKNTVMVGRTHGVHAEPITLGLKFALWAFEMARNVERLKEARETVRVGKLSGAVGTYSNIDPKVEDCVCKKLNLVPAKVATQVIQRDRHAQYLTALAIVASSLEKFAQEIRGLQRSEVLEVEEPFSKGQKGSSAMPHKKNPIICERICGLARVIRGNALSSLENVALWHERDISHSSVERIIFPDSTTLLDYMLNKFRAVVEGLAVYPEKMQENLQRSQGLIFSSRLLLELVNKGVSREEAYKLVQENAMSALKTKESFEDLVVKDERIARLISKDEIANCFDVSYYLRNIELVFSRLQELQL